MDCFKLLSGNEKRQRFIADVAVESFCGEAKAFTAEWICQYRLDLQHALENQGPDRQLEKRRENGLNNNVGAYSGAIPYPSQDDLDDRSLSPRRKNQAVLLTEKETRCSSGSMLCQLSLSAFSTRCCCSSHKPRATPASIVITSSVIFTNSARR
jgi:hypothetical protein